MIVVCFPLPDSKKIQVFRLGLVFWTRFIAVPASPSSEGKLCEARMVHDKIYNWLTVLFENVDHVVPDIQDIEETANYADGWYPELWERSLTISHISPLFT